MHGILSILTAALSVPLQVALSGGAIALALLLCIGFVWKFSFAPKLEKRALNANPAIGATTIPWMDCATFTGPLPAEPFSSGLAHELLNPVNFVSAGIDALSHNFTELKEAIQKSAPLPSKLQEGQAQQQHLSELLHECDQLLSSINKGANRIKEVVQSLHQFNKLDASALQPTLLHQQLDATLDLLQAQLKDRIEVVKEYGATAPVYCYPALLNQVFMNLLTNAAQAIAGTGTITLRTFLDQDEVVIQVKDSGAGMPPEVKGRIFEPFFTTKTTGHNSGLGLTLTYGILLKHQGSIEVESSLGLGTEFTLRLPQHLNKLLASEPAVTSPAHVQEAPDLVTL
ncbi:sensor histidine kinase [Rufibacter immobilis]|uniref:sensor histidine kinase n=1 Tax=Rufibacter immobilis TaxID=1348778 RepID=UPI0035EFFBAC